MNYITQTNIGNGGRLGNQLFGIAATVGIGKKYNLAPVFPEWEYSKYFKHPLNVANIPVTDVYHEPYFHYTDVQGFNDSIQIFTGRDKCYDIKGYFQSARYWEHCENEIKRMFEPSEELEKQKIRMKKQLGALLCSVHVRRGDYLGNNFYAQIGIDYYISAIEYIIENTSCKTFLVFSDDMVSCKKMFDEIFEKLFKEEGRRIYQRGNIIFVSETNYGDIGEMFYQSFCDHNIIANSSYSWWAAYLNKNPDKVVVAPSHWFGADSVLDTKDLYTPNMIKL